MEPGQNRMEKLDLINTLISGIVIFKVGKEYIYYKPPSAEDKTFADFFSQEQYEDALFEGVWQSEEVENLLINNGFWSTDDEKSYENIKSNIEQMKLDYFNNFYNTSTKNYIKKSILNLEDKLTKLYLNKSLFFNKTCEYIKDISYQLYLINSNTFILDGSKASNYFNISTLFTKYNIESHKIENEIRHVAKSSSWRSKWIGPKENLFDNKPSTFREFQHSIICWSYFYDGIYESLDKPSEDIIQDDIALDGWSIKQRRKREEEEKKKSSEKILPEKMSNAGEIFIPARTAKQIEDVNNLNTGYGKAKIQSLAKDLRHNNHINDSDLTTSRQEIQMKTIQNIKGKN